MGAVKDGVMLRLIITCKNFGCSSRSALISKTKGVDFTKEFFHPRNYMNDFSQAGNIGIKNLDADACVEVRVKLASVYRISCAGIVSRWQGLRRGGLAEIADDAGGLPGIRKAFAVSSFAEAEDEAVHSPK